MTIPATGLARRKGRGTPRARRGLRGGSRRSVGALEGSPSPGGAPGSYFAQAARTTQERSSSSSYFEQAVRAKEGSQEPMGSPPSPGILPGHWAGLSNLDREEIALIEEAAQSVGGKPEHLAKVIWHESRFNPQAQYGHVYGPPQFIPGLATGLIQFIPGTAARLGTSTAELFGMTFAQQMVFVKRYLQLVASGEWAGGGSGPLDTQEKMALAVFYPAYRNKPLDTPLPEAARAANPGIYSIGDYVNRVLSKSPGKAARPTSSRAPALSRSADAGTGAGVAFAIGGLLLGGLALYLISSGD